MRDLAAHGIVPGRTEANIAPPSVPEELRPHLIRGLIDGDGWITRRRDALNPVAGWSCGICGSSAVLQYVCVFAGRHGLSRPKVTKNGASGFKVTWNGVEAIRLLELLYQPGVPALPRKMEAARAVIEAAHVIYPDGYERSVRVQYRDGKPRYYFTDEGRCRTRRALRLGERAVMTWKRNIHPTRGRRRAEVLAKA